VGVQHGDCWQEFFSGLRFRRKHAMIAAFTHLFGSPRRFTARVTIPTNGLRVLDADAFKPIPGSLASSAGRSAANSASRSYPRETARDPAELYRKVHGGGEARSTKLYWCDLELA